MTSPTESTTPQTIQTSSSKSYYQFIDYDKDQERNIAYHSKNIGELIKLARSRMRQLNARVFMSKMKDPKFIDVPLAREMLIFKVIETQKIRDNQPIVSKGFQPVVRLTAKNTVAFLEPSVFLEFKETDDTKDNIIPQKINPKKLQRKQERFKKLFGPKSGRDSILQNSNSNLEKAR